MSEIENAITDGVVGGLDAGEVAAAPKGQSGVNAGSGTSTLHYARGTTQTGLAVSDLNGGPGTTPGVPYTIPGGAEDTGNADDAEARQDQAKRLAEVIAQTKIARAAASASFRAFCKGPVQGTGHVAGVQHLQAKHEREKP